MTVLYRGYDQTALDGQYNNRAMVPDHPRHIERWARDSDAVRASHPRARLDLAYGPDAREKLDFFPAGTGAPVHLFIHGGYWRALDKANFSYPAPAFNAAGIAYAAMTYPLAPRATMDDIVASVSRAISWLAGNTHDLGADPTRLSISGHSAGGHLVAMALADPRMPSGTIEGAVAISGLYDLEPIRLSYLNGELGLDEGSARRNTPIHAEPATRCPLILAVGARESDEYHRQQVNFADVWGRHGIGIETMVLDDDHFSIVGALGDPQSRLFRAISRIARVGTPADRAP